MQRSWRRALSGSVLPGSCCSMPCGRWAGAIGRHLRCNAAVGSSLAGRAAWVCASRMVSKFFAEGHRARQRTPVSRSGGGATPTGVLLHAVFATRNATVRRRGDHRWNTTFDYREDGRNGAGGIDRTHTARRASADRGCSNPAGPHSWQGQQYSLQGVPHKYSNRPKTVARQLVITHQVIDDEIQQPFDD